MCQDGRLPTKFPCQFGLEHSPWSTSRSLAGLGLSTARCSIWHWIQRRIGTARRMARADQIRMAIQNEDSVLNSITSAAIDMEVVLHSIRLYANAANFLNPDALTHVPVEDQSRIDLNKPLPDCFIGTSLEKVPNRTSDGRLLPSYYVHTLDCPLVVMHQQARVIRVRIDPPRLCLLYTSDAADE